MHHNRQIPMSLLTNSARGFNDWRHLSPRIPDHEKYFTVKTILNEKHWKKVYDISL